MKSESIDTDRMKLLMFEIAEKMKDLPDGIAQELLVGLCVNAENMPEVIGVLKVLEKKDFVTKLPDGFWISNEFFKPGYQADKKPEDHGPTVEDQILAELAEPTSKEDVAEKLGLSIQVVHTYMGKLKRRGLIKFIKRETKHGTFQRSDCYQEPKKPKPAKKESKKPAPVKDKPLFDIDHIAALASEILGIVRVWGKPILVAAIYTRSKSAKSMEEINQAIQVLENDTKATLMDGGKVLTLTEWGPEPEEKKSLPELEDTDSPSATTAEDTGASADLELFGESHELKDSNGEVFDDLSFLDFSLHTGTPPEEKEDLETADVLDFKKKEPEPANNDEPIKNLTITMLNQDKLIAYLESIKDTELYGADLNSVIYCILWDKIRDLIRNDVIDFKKPKRK